MKREGSLWVTAAVLGIAATIGVTSTPTKLPSATAGTQKSPELSSLAIAPATTPIEQGPCPDIEKLFQAFFLADENEVVAPPSCFASQPPPNSQKLQNQARQLQFVIATLPDPLHTHFPLSFDRAAEAIQEAAQDDRDNSYEYDSSWLPWETQETPYVLIDDQDKADKRKEQQEDQPGVLLFRHKLSDVHPPTSTPDRQPFDRGLVVLIVGEEPTGGIHRKQFENAVQWITALQPANNANTPPVQILGPTFSGSIPSLINLLRDTATNLSGRVGQHLRIFSGTVSSNAGVHWLNQSAAGADLASLRIEFRSFEHSGNLDMDRYCKYMVADSTELARLAVISEDETAFGGEYGNGRAEGSPCRPGIAKDGKPEDGPVYLYYPRDISALRAAYQSQSIFTHPSAQSSGETSRHSLQTDLADPEGKDHDTIHAYGADQTALSQEAELQQIVSLMRAHRTEYVLIRSSNPLDQLFLCHFFRMTYPQGRIVLVGADLLLRRETGASGLNGVMTLSTYPLLPWGQDWTRDLAKAKKGPLHAHRAFTNDGTEGTYVATRFLLRRDPITPPGTEPSTAANSGQDDVSNNFVPCNYTKQSDLPDYAPPFWLNQGGDCRYPPTWLSVLGNGGFWPVAAMDFPTCVGCLPQPSIPQLGEALLHRFLHSITSIWWSIAFLLAINPSDGSAAAAPHAWLPMPLSMDLLMFAALFWAVFHALCCCRPSITVRPAHRAHFVRPNWSSSDDQADVHYLARQRKTHHALIFFGSILVALLPITLAWGYGEMWQGGEPLRHPWPYRALLSLTWCVAAFAVCANIWVEQYLFTRNDTPPIKPAIPETKGFIEWIRESTVPPSVKRSLLYFLLSTLFLYWCIDFACDRALNDANRIPTYWRAINLTTGLSPLVPLLSLIGGLYGWFWYSLQGLAFLGEDRPRLPKADSLLIPPLSEQGGQPGKDVLAMLSREGAGDKLEKISAPFASPVVTVTVICFIASLVIGCSVFGYPAIRNLGSRDYSIVFCFWLVLCISILLANAWQLSRIWLRLRHLLQFLDKLPLRRTLAAVPGLSWGSIWQMSGNVLDVRYKHVFRQLESLTHLHQSLQSSQGVQCANDQNHAAAGEPLVCPLIDLIRTTTEKRMEFAEWYSSHWDDWKARQMDKLKAVQDSFAQTAGETITRLLIPEWRTEGKLPALSPGGKSAEVSKESTEAVTPLVSIPAYIRNGEELVCLVYMAFIQNILGRMRSLVMGMICVFLAITISVASYPFDPRPLLSGVVVALFVVLSLTIVAVYSQMHRDPTLSNLTGTTPGELGADFWFKLVGFGAGPVLGLIASVFPEFTDFLLSWVQPGVASIK